ncbi:MAG: hypothetical protein IPK28_23145 [Devosia sp.]|nr:hypothetical protein [Devosia sp.]
MNISKRTFLGLAAGLIAATAMTPVMAQDGGTVTIYTAHKSSIVDTLLPIFEQETGLKAEVVKLGSGDIMKRVQAEAGAPRRRDLVDLGQLTHRARRPAGALHAAGI